ncbi:MAG: hypothetical protein ACOCQS_02105 [Bacillota bacterium]
MTVGSLKQPIFDINGSRHGDFGWQQSIMKKSYYKRDLFKLKDAY